MGMFINLFAESVTTVTLEPTSKPYKWRIMHGSNIAGKVSIDPETHSIDIKVRSNTQGIGIGSKAYKIACELSGFDKVYATIRKSNISSIKAAIKAGFKQYDNPKSNQYNMVWSK